MSAGRPTKSHEQVFLLAKSARYFFDAEAIAEPLSELTVRIEATRRDLMANRNYAAGSGRRDPDLKTRMARMIERGGRNARTVWTIATEPFSEAHFATFPTELGARCIKAGTSEHGCCGKCGAPLVRVVERIGGPQGDHRKRADFNENGSKQAHASGTVDGSALSEIYRKEGYPERRTTGWQPSCACNAGTVPCRVLDPFAGSGTVGVVCSQMGRDFTGIELNPAYAEMARKRIRTKGAPLFNRVSEVLP